ncbi:hypothetical protein ACFQZU_15365, partial [Streptomonospora algeriensis]
MLPYWAYSAVKKRPSIGSSSYRTNGAMTARKAEAHTATPDDANSGASPARTVPARGGSDR